MIALALSVPALLHALHAVAGAAAEGSAPAAPLQEAEAPPVYPEWTGAFTLGIIFTEGNSDTSSAAGTFNLVRRAEVDRWTMDAFWNWSEQGTDTSSTPADDSDDTEVTTLNYGAGLKYDYFTTPKLYYTGTLSGKVDPIADLQIRGIGGAGIGYQVREDEKLKWGVEVGLAYVEENYEGFDNDGFLAARLASILTWQISQNTSFDQTAETFPSLEDSEDSISKISNTLKTNIAGNWISQLQYVLDYDDSTPPGVEEADHRVVLGIGWSLSPPSGS